MVRRDLVAPVGRDHEQRPTVVAVEQRDEQIERRRVRPLHVVEKDDERLLVARERVVWWGFVGETRPHRTVFRAAELQVLRRAGLVTPDSRLTLRARFDGLAGAVQAARRQLILVVPEQVAGEACAPHPLLDELVGRVLGSENALARLTLTPEQLARGEGLAARLARVATEAAPMRPLPVARRQWHIDPSLIRPREAESASSLEKLMGCPLAWTLHYQAGLRSASRRGIPGGPLLAGKLGHRLIEELHLSGRLRGSLDNVRRAAEETLDKLFEREGTPLLAAGASDARHQLRLELVNAAVALSGLLDEAKLELVGVEVPVEAELGGRPLRGRIDVLLRAANGEERVLDLKYGASSYAGKLKSGQAIQLAIYADARRQQSGAAQAPPAGYFSLKSQRLMATDAAQAFGHTPHPGPPLSRTAEQIRNTVAAITQTLEGGRIPVAGVRETGDAGILPMLGVTQERAPDHLALPAKDACQYCELGGVCGRSWEQPW